AHKHRACPQQGTDLSFPGRDCARYSGLVQIAAAGTSGETARRPRARTRERSAGRVARSGEEISFKFPAMSARCHPRRANTRPIWTEGYHLLLRAFRFARFFARAQDDRSVNDEKVVRSGSPKNR